MWRFTAATVSCAVILACIPAHNEEGGLTETLQSLLDQTRPPDAIIVIVDRCTDYTWLIAKAMGAMPVATVKNTGFKAEAINEVLTPILMRLDAEDYVLIVDADTRLVPEWIERALETGSPTVGGVFQCIHPTNLVGQLQCNEYVRYARQVARRKAKALVLTGTATMAKVYVLRQVLRNRGFIYSSESRTEDNEFTLAIKHLGYQPVSPMGCVVYTETMTNLRSLWGQRFRWYRGSIEDLFRYGVTKVTIPYIARTAMLYLSIVIFALYLFFVLPLGFKPSLLWSIIGGIFVVERVVTVRRGGWKGMLVALPLVVEMAYVAFLDAIFLAALVTNRRRW